MLPFPGHTTSAAALDPPSQPSTWLARLSFAVLILGLLACAGSRPPSAARSAAELAAVAPTFEPHPEDVGQGCSPKGCLRAPPEAALLAREPVQPPAPVRRARPPVVRQVVSGKSDEEIARLLRNDVSSVGSMAFGTAAHGGLLNPVHMPEDDRWILVHPPQAWGTAETIQYLVTAIDAVNEHFPDSPPLFIGAISQREGGYLYPHLSHQSGRDVDVGYFYKSKPAWYRRATRRNLDVPRTWALIRTLIARTDVRYIFIDRRVQGILREYAEKIGEDNGWLESIFHGNDTEPPIILHEPGHDTHFHVRFYSPVAEETARRCYRTLLAQHKLKPLRYNIRHTARKGDTLLSLARRYSVSVTAIMQANHLTEKVLHAGEVYQIPREGSAGPSEEERPPPRRVPPVRAPVGNIASL
ncbi:MAG TPA: penicillin-insensitive murein endopeptidase [Polyangiaceae bacterium]|nr:penicillin-insensitive murein endopeptidase [Polyangiaceae bacterium]